MAQKYRMCLWLACLLVAGSTLAIESPNGHAQSAPAAPAAQAAPAAPAAQAAPACEPGYQFVGPGIGKGGHYFHGGCRRFDQTTGAAPPAQAAIACEPGYRFVGPSHGKFGYSHGGCQRFDQTTGAATTAQAASACGPGYIYVGPGHRKHGQYSQGGCVRAAGRGHYGSTADQLNQWELQTLSQPGGPAAAPR
jgi:hypothetical protein